MAEGRGVGGAGGGLVLFCAGGDGTWPVWFGRSAAGEVVSVVVVRSYL
ncbi:hypothetical protein ACFVU0_40050 [Streptomyces sp. NPDC058122]